MTGIARFVQDKDLKDILRATDGLWTGGHARRDYRTAVQT